MARLRGAAFLPLLILVVCAPFQGALAAPADDPSIRQLNEKFTKALVLVQGNAAEKLDLDKAIYDGALPGMMRTLDPHSNFFDPKEFALIREEQEGHYSGIGMEVTQQGSKTVVTAPFSGSPAWRAGIRPGDVIMFVNDKSTEGMTSTEVADMLKGQRGTHVKVAVSREGAPDYLTFALVREDISRKSVQDAFWLKPGIAYVRILSFGDNTDLELADTLSKLGEDSIKGLVLDLRGNPGGVLNSAVGVADHFLPKGAVVVSQWGRASAKKVYTASAGNHGRDYPIVAVVDRMSASAAEIVSGALQDHDRALILGEVTFGKGLVQTVFPTGYNTALALTTAHFYTPSGRLIQRDYSKESYFDYYNVRRDNLRNDQDVKKTDSGRTVYGGGGITPDDNYQTVRLDQLESQLYRNGLFNFSRTYFANHSSHVDQGWMPDDQIVAELHDYLLKNKYAFTEKEWTTDHDWVKRYLTREMYVWAFSKDVSDKVFAQMDPEVTQAEDALPQAATLAANAHKQIVERTGNKGH